MKKTASAVLLLIFTLSICVTSFAQRAKPSRLAPIPANDNFVEFERIIAFTDGMGAYLRWEMKSETGNVGFFIYRVGPNGTELVNPSLMQGSVGKTGERTAYGEIYELFDEHGDLNSGYIIQSMALDGRRVATNAFIPKFTTNFEADTGHAKSYFTDRGRFGNRNVKSDNPDLPSDLQTIVTNALQAPDPVNQAMVVTQQGGVKIGVKNEGMYRVTRAELQAAGFDVNSDSANWRLFVNGNEQAIVVGSGGQYIDFYGKGIDVRETDTRIYYLIPDTVPGKRMTQKILGSIGGNVVSNNYRLVTEKKERTNYDSHIENGDIENYFGRVITSTIPTCTNPMFPCLSVDLPGFDASGPNAIVTVRVQGLTNGPHSVRVVLNGHRVGLLQGYHYDNFSGEFSVPTSYLLEQNNVLQLNTVSSSDADYFDSIKVDYSRKYAADQNSALFFTPGYRKIDLDGFSSSNVRVFDTTLDGNVQQIIDLPIVQNGAAYTVKIPSNRPAVMFAVDDSALLHPASVTAYNPSSLGNVNNTADAIVISYSDPDFMAAAETWANYRRSQAGGGFTVKVVDVADIYDDFSYGLHTAAAINQFLEYTQDHWQSPKPHYLLLLGDASWDARDYQGLGNFDLVPTKMVDLIYGETGSDEALADFNHDGLADMAVGRVSARTASVITTVFNKTTAFEVPAMQNLDRGALCAFDLPFGFDFNAMCHILMNQLPSRTPITYVNRGLPEPNPNNEQDPMAHMNLIDGINSDKYIVNYSGHGSVGTWASTAFFSSNDVPGLTNAGNQSIFTMLTCFNGVFDKPEYDSLAENLLKAPNGGAVAAWASTTETTPDYQLTMGTQFYNQIGAGNIKRMGDLVINAKATIAGSDVGYSWALLGDPMLKVRQ